MLLHQKKMDDQITKNVIDELDFDPAVKVVDLEVETKDGKVTLSGTCDTYLTKAAAVKAALRVAGVREIVNNIITDPVTFNARKDEDIEASVYTALDLDASILSDEIGVQVENGNVRLYG